MKIAITLFVVSFLMRIMFLEKFPPGFTADEATMGYDAFNILKTGKDQFGNPLPLAFRSFGDYRPPLYGYVTVPFVALFGLMPDAVRLPSSTIGSLEVVLVYVLGKELFSKKTGLFSALLLMLSPWSILHTGFAQEANLSTVTILAGVLCFILWARRSNLLYAVNSMLFFSLSLYSYHSARLTTPLLIVSGFGVLGIFGKLDKERVKQLFIASIAGFVVLLPLLLYTRQFPEAIFRRASAQSVFTDSGIAGALWHDIVTMPAGYPVWLSRIQHNKPRYYGRVIIRNYLSHFDPAFLFFSGDPHERFRTPYSGLLNWAMLLFLPVGFILFLRGDRAHRYILSWIFISPIVASLSTIVPNSQHAQDMMIPLHLIGGAGVVWIFDHVSHLKRLFILALFVVSLSRFLYGYTQIIPYHTKYLQAWHYYGQLFEKLSPHKDKKIVFLGGQYFINWAFFLKYDPETFQKEVRISRPDNLVEFDHVESFSSYEFRKTRDIPKELNGDTLYVRLNEEGESLPENVVTIDSEMWPDRKRAYVLFTR